MIFIKMGSIRFWSRLKSDKSTFLTPLKKRNRLPLGGFKNILAAITLGTFERMHALPYLYKKKDALLSYPVQVIGDGTSRYLGCHLFFVL